MGCGIHIHTVLFLSFTLACYIPGRVLIQCLKPIQTEGLTKEDVNKLTESTREVMMEVFTKNSIATGAIKVDKLANGFMSDCISKAK